MEDLLKGGYGNSGKYAIAAISCQRIDTLHPRHPRPPSPSTRSYASSFRMQRLAPRVFVGLPRSRSLLQAKPLIRYIYGN